MFASPFRCIWAVDQELARALRGCTGGVAAVAAECLNECVQASGDQEGGADPAGGMPECAGQAVAQ